MDAQNASQEAQAGGSLQNLDTEMSDVSGTSPPIPAVPDEQTEQADIATSTASTTEEHPESSSDQAESSRPAERVTVMIHGSPVDITDTGIDPTFLEALSNEYRNCTQFSDLSPCKMEESA
jgi:E3 ubiquitin-protein ligase HUWE1